MLFTLLIFIININYNKIECLNIDSDDGLESSSSIFNIINHGQSDKDHRDLRSKSKIWFNKKYDGGLPPIIASSLGHDYQNHDHDNLVNHHYGTSIIESPHYYYYKIKKRWRKNKGGKGGGWWKRKYGRGSWWDPFDEKYVWKSKEKSKYKKVWKEYN